MENFQSIFKTIRDNKMIEKDDFIVVGLSGGADSVCLFRALIEYKKIVPFKLEAAHINHGVRGEEAKHDEIFSKKLAEKYDIKFHLYTGNMDELAKKYNISSEDAGRRMRYGFFNSILKDKPNGKIAVAHHLSDQAETILMNILRGSGLDGLSAMNYINGNIIRPLLDIDRQKVEDILENLNQNYCTDMTNTDIKYRRNLIRRELIPFIKENINPNIENTLFRMGNIIEKDLEFIDDYTDNLVDKIIIKEDSKIYINKADFIYEKKAIQRRVIRYALYKLTGTFKDISYDMVENIIDLFYSVEQKEFLFSDYRIYSSYDRVIFDEIVKDNIDNLDYLVNLNKEGKTIFNKYYIYSGIINYEDFKSKGKVKNTYYFNNKDLKSEDLILRFRQPGDKFRPFGMRGSKKIKKYFIDEKIPKDIRDNIPLLVDKDGNILAIIGYKRSDYYKINKNSEEIFYISYEVQEDGK